MPQYVIAPGRTILTPGGALLAGDSAAPLCAADLALYVADGTVVMAPDPEPAEVKPLPAVEPEPAPEPVVEPVEEPEPEPEPLPPVLALRAALAGLQADAVLAMMGRDDRPSAKRHYRRRLRELEA